MFWIILIIILIIILFILHKFRKNKTNCIQLFSGANGTGKSFTMTHRARSLYFKAVRKWKRVNYPFFTKPLDLIPYFKKKRLNNEYYGLDKPVLYSSYPILIKKGVFSDDISNDYMFLEKSFPLGSQVVIDEFSSWIDQFEYKEEFSKTLNDHIQKWRHYHGNDSHLFVADQCTNNIPIQVRYRCNNAIVCKSIKHYLWFIHIVNYKFIDLTDDIKNVEIVDNVSADSDDKVNKFIFFSFKRKYDDRAYSNRYYYVDKNPHNSKFILSPFKVLFTLLKPNKKENYRCLDEDIKKENSEENCQD